MLRRMAICRPKAMGNRKSMFRCRRMVQTLTTRLFTLSQWWFTDRKVATATLPVMDTATAITTVVDGAD